MTEPSPLLPATPPALLLWACRPLLPRLQGTCYQVLPSLSPPSRQPGFRHKPHPLHIQNAEQVPALSTDTAPQQLPHHRPGGSRRLWIRRRGAAAGALTAECVIYSQGGKRVITEPTNTHPASSHPMPATPPLGVVRGQTCSPRHAGPTVTPVCTGTNPHKRALAPAAGYFYFLAEPPAHVI